MSFQLVSSRGVNPHLPVHESCSNKMFPVQLASRVQDRFLLQIIVDKNCSLFGAVTEGNLSYKVSLKGLKTTYIKPDHMENAMALMAKSRLFFDGHSILLTPKLVGGGCVFSTENPVVRNLNKGVRHIQLGDQASRQGKFDRAIKEYTSGVECLRNHYGPDGEFVLLAMNDLGDCHNANQNFEEALLYFRQAQEGAKRTGKVELEAKLTAKIEQLSVIVSNIEKYQNAVRLLGEGEGKATSGSLRGGIGPIENALEIFREIVGEDHRIVMRCLTSLGGIHLGLHQFQDSFDCYVAAQEIHKKLHNGREDSDIASCITNVRDLIPHQDLLKNYKMKPKKDDK